MRNKSVRETLRFLTADAKGLSELSEEREIVDRWENEILAYIEQLEEDNEYYAERERVRRENA